MKPRTTQAALARKAGVSSSTVSLALRGDPRIPEKTRKRIEKIAALLGYAPNPMLTALSSYRKQSRPAAYHASIAWLVSNPHAGSKGLGDFGLYYTGAQERARQLGYVLDEINLAGENKDKHYRWLRRHLDDRNITGLILTPSLVSGGEFKFDLSRYSAVRLGYSYRHPLLNTVANTQFRTTLTAMQQAVALGYRRIGIILTKAIDERTSRQLLGGYLAGQHLLPRKDWVSPFYDLPEVDLVSAVFKWIIKQKIDCFIAGSTLDLYHALRERGLDLPGTIGYVDTQLSEKEEFFSGIHQNARQIGVEAIDLLVGMMHRNEIGIPAIPSHLLIEGSWRAGETLTRRKLPA